MRQESRVSSTIETSTTVIWTGASGNKYTYEAYALGRHPSGYDTPSWPNAAGSYILAKLVGDNWVAISIGETTSLMGRKNGIGVNNRCVARHGGTHVHFRANPSKTRRLAEALDLIAKHKPPCAAANKPLLDIRSLV